MEEDREHDPTNKHPEVIQYTLPLEPEEGEEGECGTENTTQPQSLKAPETLPKEPRGESRGGSGPSTEP